MGLQYIAFPATVDVPLWSLSSSDVFFVFLSDGDWTGPDRTPLSAPLPPSMAGPDRASGQTWLVPPQPMAMALAWQEGHHGGPL